MPAECGVLQAGEPCGVLAIGRCVDDGVPFCASHAGSINRCLPCQQRATIDAADRVWHGQQRAKALAGSKPLPERLQDTRLAPMFDAYFLSYPGPGTMNSERMQEWLSRRAAAWEVLQRLPPQEFLQRYVDVVRSPGLGRPPISLPGRRRSSTWRGWLWIRSLAVTEDAILLEPGKVSSWRVSHQGVQDSGSSIVYWREISTKERHWLNDVLPRLKPL